jgi:hypothetical protein
MKTMMNGVHGDWAVGCRMLAMIAGGMATVATTAMGQQFQRAVGTTATETSFDIKTTFDGGWVNVGSRVATDAPTSMIVVKHLPVSAALAGSILWDGIYETDGRIVGYSVVQPTDGTYVVAGESDAFAANNFGITLTRLGPAGNVIWSWVYRGTPFADPAGTAVTLSKDGFLVVGRFRPNTATPLRGVLLKTAPDGSIIFQRNYQGINVAGGPAPLSFTDVRELADQTIVVSGTLSNNGQLDRFVMRTDPAGNVIQARIYGVANFNETADGLDYDGGARVVVSGRTNELGAGIEGTTVMTINAFTLIPAWDETIKDFTNGYAAINVVSDGTISVAGSENLAVGGMVRDAGMFRLTPAGGPIWSWRYGLATTDDFFESGVPTNFGPIGFAGAGGTRMAGFGALDVYFTQADNLGSTGCLEKRVDLQIRPTDTVHVTWNVPVVDNPARAALPLNRISLLKDDIFCFTSCPCVADFDMSGGTPDAGDIDAFFDAWLLGDPAADADCSGGTPDAADIAEFFSQWLAGGC